MRAKGRGRRLRSFFTVGESAACVGHTHPPKAAVAFEGPRHLRQLPMQGSFSHRQWMIESDMGTLMITAGSFVLSANFLWPPRRH